MLPPKRRSASPAGWHESAVRLSLDVLIHHNGGLFAPGGTDIASWNAGDRAPRRHVLQHRASRRHPHAIADLDIAEDLGARSHHHAGADLRVAIAALIAGAAQGDAVQQRAIVADHRRLADDDAGGMVEHHALADACGGMDVDLEDARGEALEIEREIVTPRMPQRMREAEGLKRVIALEIEQGIDQTPAGRIALGELPTIGAAHVADATLVREHLMEGLMQESGIHRMLEPLREPGADRVLESRLAQDRRVDEAPPHPRPSPRV